MRKELPCIRGTAEELWEEIVILHSEEVGDIALHMETVPVVDALTGYPEQPRDGEEICVWLSEAMTMSLPPQNTPLLVLVNLPEDGAAPQLHEIERMESNDLFTTCGEMLCVRPETEMFPYRTRQIVTVADLQPGTRILVWGEMDRVMILL